MRSSIMPIFEFRCAECGNEFEELFITSNEKTHLSCPRCKGEALERVVSRTNYTIGDGPGANQPKISTNSCNGGKNQCMTLELPGYTK